MPGSDALAAAVKAGVLGQAEADRLAAFLVTYRAQDRLAADTQGDARQEDDTEFIRFVRGFHDVFLTIGVSLLLAGIGGIAETLGRGLWSYPIAIAAWALAEYFTRIKRLLLPSFVLSIVFGIAAGFSAAALLPDMFGGPEAVQGGWLRPLAGTQVIVSILVASLLFYLRFRLPFTLAQIAVAAIFVVLAFAHASQSIQLLLLIVGLLIFAVALLFDLQDPERRTVAADNAFWLHLTAAPLIVHTTIYSLVGQNLNARTAADLTLPIALTVMGVIAGLAFVALLIDRRALLIAGLSYFGTALFVLLRHTEIESSAVLSVTIFILGGALLLLGVGWRTLRRLAIGTLMPPALARRLPTI